MLIGIDIEDIQKIKKIIEGVDFHNYQGILKSVFSSDEIKNGLTKKHPAKYFATRFAGKEAFLKALGIGINGDFMLSEIEFLNDQKGMPYLNCLEAVKMELVRRGIKKVNVSFSHSQNNAIALIILEE